MTTDDDAQFDISAIEDAFLELAVYVAAAVERIAVAMAELAAVAIEQLSPALDRWHRQWFSLWLQRKGMPLPIADWLSVRCPKRWLPEPLWLHEQFKKT